MRVRTVTKKIYIAIDGKEFLSQSECLAYESQLAEKRSNVLSNFIQFYDHFGNPIFPVNLQYKTAFLAHLLSVPFDDGSALEAWEKYVPSELDACICGDETDTWFVSDENDNWEEWTIIQSNYHKAEAMIERLKKGG